MSDHPTVMLYVARLRQQVQSWGFSDGLSPDCAKHAAAYVRARAMALEMGAGVAQPDTLQLETEAALRFDDALRPDIAECVEGPARRLLAFAHAKGMPARSEFGGAPLVARPCDELGWVVGRWISTSIERGLW